ncbi:acetylglutamate kinase [Sulfobacillus thermosulfidooxidans]|uniref:acetylglutamate kinase n=1 Tax=Sulfobacillus thermosulfidooxidans TaxID=28034 RepID=UPI0004299573|nr:acetylglutamate kinase [Sulfobacillus thermosulfidooxidans]
MRVVIKVGGSVLSDGPGGSPWMTEVQTFVAEGHQLAIVHGGGPAISESLRQTQTPIQFYQGQRVTTPEVLGHVIRILRGEMNALLVHALNRQGITAIGLSGMDGAFMVARHLPPKELGYVGYISDVKADLLDQLWTLGFVPVIAPLAPNEDHTEILNCNGDGVAEAVARHIQADLLVFYTDRGGLRTSPDPDARIVAHLTQDEIGTWIDQGKATEGMIPKLQAAQRALQGGVKQVLIGAFYDESEGTTHIV